MFSHESLSHYVGQLVVIRRDNDEGDKPLVDRVVEADNGQLKLQNEGWMLPGDVLFTVSADMPDHMIIGLAEVKRLSHDQARRLPEQIRQFHVREAGPTYAQFQEIAHQPDGDAKAIKISIEQVHELEEGYRYSLKQRSRVLAGTFSDANIQTFIEKGYLPMPETQAPEAKTEQDLQFETLVEQMADLMVQNETLMKANQKLQSQIVAQSDLVPVMQQMTRIIRQQGRLLRDASLAAPRQTLTYKRLLNTAVQEGDPSDNDLNRLLKAGWEIKSDQLIIQPGKDSPLRVVRLEREVRPELPQLGKGTEMILPNRASTLRQELIMNGVDATRTRLNQQAIHAARQRFDAKKARQQTGQQGAQSS